MKSNLIFKLLVVVLLLLKQTEVFSQCTISNLTQNQGNSVGSHTGCGQVFTAPCTGDIFSVSVFYNTLPTVAYDRVLYIRDGNTSTSTIIHSQVIPFSSIVLGLNTFVLTGPVSINTGEINGFEIYSTIDPNGSSDGVSWNSGGAYTGGDAWFSGSLLDGYDLTFEVQIGGSCVISSITPNVTSLPDLIGECSVSAPSAPTATDNCGNMITGTTTSTFPITIQGTTVVTWTYTSDVVTNTQTQNVIVDDVTPPLAPTFEVVSEECSATVTAPTTTDDCMGVITGTTTDPLTYSMEGTYEITWLFDDGNGNSTPAIQTITIDDVTVPESPIVLEISDVCAVTAIAPTTTDNCLGIITGTTADPLTYSTPGNYNIEWTFDDGNGNVATIFQSVIISGLDVSVTALDDITYSANATGVTYQWIDCSTNTSIPDATEQSFSATANGSYAVIIDNGDCADTSSCFVIDQVGLSIQNEQLFTISPNPTNGFVTLDFNTIEATLMVRDAQGKLILSSQIQSGDSLDLNHLPNGVYFFEVNTNEQLIVKRVIKI